MVQTDGRIAVSVNSIYGCGIIKFYSRYRSQDQIFGPGLEVVRNLGSDVQNILRQFYILSYDNAKVAVDLRQTTTLQDILQ